MNTYFLTYAPVSEPYQSWSLDQIPEGAPVQVIVKNESVPRFVLRILDPSLFVLLQDHQVRELTLDLGDLLELSDGSVVSVQLAPDKGRPDRRFKEASDLRELPVGTPRWITCTPEGIQLLNQLRRAARTPLSLYLAGETGIGKDVLARMMHAWSAQSTGPFIALHCAALPASLAETELFGHVRGSFTGAIRDRPGALLQAHGGTLFLDEIADLSLDLQVKLLRFLETGEIRPVGSEKLIYSQARVVCATHRSLEDMVEKGLFRKDLYYRIASITLEIPSLMERPADIELLAHEFAKQLQKRLTPRAMSRLRQYSWPGNVRELKHAIERASSLAPDGRSQLVENDFAFLMPKKDAHSDHRGAVQDRWSLAQLERWYIHRTLAQFKGNRTRTARTLGIARSTLFEILKRQEASQKISA